MALDDTEAQPLWDIAEECAIRRELAWARGRAEQPHLIQNLRDALWVVADWYEEHGDKRAEVIRQARDSIDRLYPLLSYRTKQTLAADIAGLPLGRVKWRWYMVMFPSLGDSFRDAILSFDPAKVPMKEEKK